METSSTRLGVRKICRSPWSSFKNSAAISNCSCAMRNGFKSSRGAIRGTMGGAPSGRIGVVGFATVAMVFKSFLPLRVSSFSLTALESYPAFHHLAENKTLFSTYSVSTLPVRRPPQTPRRILIPALRRAKMHQLPAIAIRNRQRLRQVHPAHRIAHQLPRRNSRPWRCIARRIRLFRPTLRLHRPPQRPARNPPDQPHGPRNHHYPKHKPHQSSQPFHHLAPICLPAGGPHPTAAPNSRTARVYASLKARVKRKCVISMS